MSDEEENSLCADCPNKVECSRCHRQLCHSHQGSACEKHIEGHYKMPAGVYCVPCAESLGLTSRKKL